MATEKFRANVGIALVKDGKVLVFERSDVAGAFQLPQGGIDVGEKPYDTAIRELHEETGLSSDDVTLIGEYPEWLAYEYPPYLEKGKYLGQTQKLFVFRLDTSEDSIKLDLHDEIEFVSFKWIALDELESVARDFRKPSYRKYADFITELQ